MVCQLSSPTLRRLAKSTRQVSYRPLVSVSDTILWTDIAFYLHQYIVLIQQCGYGGNELIETQAKQV
jgi:hypothetical protein